MFTRHPDIRGRSRSGQLETTRKIFYHRAIPEAVSDAKITDGISDGAESLYSLLVSYCHDKPICWPGLETLAERSIKSVSTITRRLFELKKAGLIVVNKRPKSNHNEYYLPDLAPKFNMRKNDQTPAAIPMNEQTVNSKMTRPPSQKCADPLLELDQEKNIKEKREKEKAKEDHTPNNFSKGESSEKNIREVSERITRDIENRLDLDGPIPEILKYVRGRIRFGYISEDFYLLIEAGIGGGRKWYEWFDEYMPVKEKKSSMFDIDDPEPGSKAEEALIERKKAAQEIQRKKDEHARQVAMAARPKLPDKEKRKRNRIAYDSLSTHERKIAEMESLPPQLMKSLSKDKEDAIYFAWLHHKSQG